MQRVWLYARLSRTTEASTSVERQLQDGRRLAEQRWPGRDVTEITDDGVSGAIEPAKREGFGTIVTNWRPGDVVIFWKVDRLARSLIGFTDVMRLAQDAEVSLVSVRDSFDLSTPDGRMQANILATFAEYEREMVKTRVASMRKHLIRQGKWTGGRAPYGLRSEPHPSGQGKALVRDPEAAAVVREIAHRVIGGEAATAIARDLQDRGVAPPRVHTTVKDSAKPAAWSFSSIRTVLRNPTIVGHQRDPETGRIVREKGRPVQVWEPIISEEEQSQALARMPENSGRQAPRGHHWLYDIAKCGHCNGNLKQTNAGIQQPDVQIFRCNGSLRERHKQVTVRCDVLAQFVDDQVRYYMGGVFAPERVWVGGADHTADLARLRTYVAELDADRKAGMFNTPEAIDRYRRLMADAQQEIADLEKLPPVESGWKIVRSDRRFLELWDAWTDDERGDELRDWKMQVYVRRPDVPRARVPIDQRARVHFGDLQDAADEMQAIADAEEHADRQAEWEAAQRQKDPRPGSVRV